jgi:hypothetical protein
VLAHLHDMCANKWGCLRMSMQVSVYFGWGKFVFLSVGVHVFVSGEHAHVCTGRACMHVYQDSMCVSVSVQHARVCIGRAYACLPRLILCAMMRYTRSTCLYRESRCGLPRLILCAMMRYSRS